MSAIQVQQHGVCIPYPWEQHCKASDMYITVLTVTLGTLA